MKRNYLLPILISLFALGNNVARAADAPLKADASAEEILQAFEKQWPAWKNYSCVLDTNVRRGEKSDHTVVSFTFKHPNYFRSNVIEGTDKGATVARGAAGKIRAQSGGLLSIITITMKDDDPRLADPRGARLQDGDWGSLIAQFRKRAAQGWKFTRLPDQKVKEADCYAIEAAGPADEMGETREVFCFEKGTFAVRARRLWEGKLQVDNSVYYDIKLDQTLPDDFFDL